MQGSIPRTHLGSQCQTPPWQQELHRPSGRTNVLPKPGAVVKVNGNLQRVVTLLTLEKRPCWPVFHVLGVSFLEQFPFAAGRDRMGGFSERLLTRVPVFTFPRPHDHKQSDLGFTSFKGVFPGILVKQNSIINCLGNQKHMFESLYSICAIPAGTVAGKSI